MNISTVLNEFIKVSIALSTEKNTQVLLEHILLAAKSLSHADGGTIYSVTDDQLLIFDTLYNDTLGLHLGGSSGRPIDFNPISIYVNGEINQSTAVAYAAATGDIINIDDIYEEKQFYHSRAKQIDTEYKYRTQSVLTIPMYNHDGDLNGVMQLINARQNNQIVSFSESVAQMVKALASLASVALANRELIDDMEDMLFQSISRLINKAMDEKSPDTDNQCQLAQG